MASLLETQELFWQAITWPTGVQGFLEQADSATRDAFARTFRETAEFSRVERMNVYADAYFWRLHDVLKEQFPTVRWLARPEPFRNLLTDYVLQCPSSDPDIRQFGRRFPEFVRGHSLGATSVLGAVAEAEWTLVEVLDGPDEPVLTRSDLQSQNVDALLERGFRPTGTTRLLDLDCDFVSLHRSYRDAESPPASASPTSTPLLVYRKQLAVYHRTPCDAETAALRALLAGQSFVGICNAAVDCGRAIRPQDVAEWLGRWLDDGLIHRGDG